MTTYYARNDVLYSGGDKLFSITFSYIKKEHIKVFVNEEETDNFTFNNDSQILINDEITVGDLISIRRNTPIDTRMVVFSDTSILNKDNQNLAQTQVFDAVQEMKDDNTTFQINIEEIISDFEGDTNTAIEAIETIANTAKSNSETALEEAGTALSYSNAAVNTANAASTLASTANTNASNAVSTATTAATNASNAVSTANTANTNSQNAVSTANTASTNASSALEKANTALNTSNTALSNSQTAVSTANTASTNASSAVSTANTASSTASSAASTASEAKTTAETASGKVDTFEENIADVIEAAQNINQFETAVQTATTKAQEATTAAQTATNKASEATTAAQTATTKAQEAVDAVATIKQPDWEQTDNTQKDFIKNKPLFKTINNISILGSDDINTKEVFIAEYGTTTFTDIQTAYNTGKYVICKDITTIFPLVDISASSAIFSSTFNNNYVYSRAINSSNTWSRTNISLATSSTLSSYEQSSNKITSISSSSTDTQYPSAKCTYNAITACKNTTKRNIGELVTSVIPLNDNKLHLLDGTLLTSNDGYTDFINYCLSLREKEYNITLKGNSTINESDELIVNISNGYGGSFKIQKTSSGIVYLAFTTSSDVTTKQAILQFTTRYSSSFYLTVENGVLSSRDDGNREVLASLANVTANTTYYIKLKSITSSPYGWQFSLSTDNINWSSYITCFSSSASYLEYTPNYCYLGYANNLKFQLQHCYFIADTVEIGNVYAINYLFPSYFTNENSWQSSVTNYGVCGKFVYDSENNTVRLPKITGFIEGTDNTTYLGNLTQAGLPDHSHTYQYQSHTSAKLGSTTAKSLQATYSTENTGLASANNSIYGNSTTVQPQSIKVLYYMVISQ